MNDLLDPQASQQGGGLLSTAKNFFGSPTGMGLLAAAAGGLSGARRGQLWNNLGRAAESGLLGYTQAQEQQRNSQVAELQLRRLKQAEQDQQDMRSLAQQFYRAPAQIGLAAGASAGDQVGMFDGQGNYVPPVKNVGPTVGNAALSASARPSFDMSGFVDAYMAKDPLKAMQLRASMVKELPFDKFKPENYTPGSVAEAMRTGDFSNLVRQDPLHFADTGGAFVGLDKYTGQPISTTPKTGNPYSDLLIAGPKGVPVPNAPLISAKSNIARAGAPSVTVKNDIKMGESIAGQIGPMVKDSYTAAQGAVQTANAADQVLKALDRGNLVTGPFANGRLSALQVGEAMGVTGRDAQERITNTRQAIQGLAQMTLQGRKQMSGQGAITESESRLAERAISGDITMTAAELRTLANASRRAAQWTYQQHQSQLKNMRDRPDLAGMANFYDTAPFPGTGNSAGSINFEELR